MDIGGLVLQNMTEIDRDRMAPCARCGTVWYVIHHRDGLCHNCQKAIKKARRSLFRDRLLPFAGLAIAISLILRQIFG